jgi:RimJ/RimL family protein N-acetyltransferase
VSPAARNLSRWRETERLELRAFVAADFPDIWRLDRDPRVMRYIGDGRPASREAVRSTLERIIHYPELYPDLGIWRAARRDTGAFVGWFLLKYAGRSSDVEVGYRLLPEAWGNGFATEGAKTLVDYGFNELGLHRIIGITHPDNHASQRVLRKAGLDDCGWGRYYERHVRVFAADNPDR